MKLIKLAFVNVKKSYKDFSIYFLTITIGICIFYIFNALDSQESMLEISAGLKSVLSSVSTVMAILSAFVSVVLGFLILYANNFLIKRRKKEFAVYLTLGMDRHTVAMISMIETMFIGLLSLVCGIVLGIFLSQFMAILTANMFAIKMTSFSFVYSSAATVKTMAYFLGIFIIVMMFNTISISKLKLITLLNAHKQGGRRKVNSLGMSVVLFILSIITLMASYYIAVTMDITESINILSIIGGIMGTYMFYYSISGFILIVIQSNKTKYYTGLNIFLFRQLSARMRKTVISTTVICILLFLALSALASTSSLMNAFSGDVSLISPYDASLRSFNISEAKLEDEIIKNLEENNVLDEFDRYNTAVIYESDFAINNLLKEELNYELYTDIIGLSDFNELRQLNGLKTITLNETECYIVSNVVELETSWNTYMMNEEILINGIGFSSKNRIVDTLPLVNSYMANNMGTIVVNDQLLTQMNFEPKQFILNGYYRDTDETVDESIENNLAVYNDNEELPYVILDTKNEFIDETLGLKMMLTYVGIYLGLIFLIACSTIIALIQLSESDENIVRYSLLYKIGASEKDIKATIFKSVFIGFGTPLSLALVHSVFGVWLINNVVVKFGDANIMNNVIYALCVMLFVYGLYFVITYNGVKRTIYRNLKV